MGRLDDKVAVITGAGGGMGREAAILFAGEGARVCVADVNAEAAEETVSLCPGEAFSVEVDVADEEGVAGMYAADVRALRRCRRALQQRRHLARRRRVGARDERRGVAAGAGHQREGCLPVLQARHPAPAEARRRFGDQRRLVRRDRGRRHLADLLHRVQRRGARDEPRARRPVRPRGSARERALPGPGGDAAPALDLRRRSGGARAPAQVIGPWGGWRSRARS